MNIHEFKDKHKPKKISSLKKFEAEILELHNANYSLMTITKFLNENGIKTSFQNVSRFIKCINNATSKFNNTKKIENKSTVAGNSILLPKLEKKGKDLDLKEAPDWAN